MKILHVVTFILAVVGAINWGLMGLGDLTTGLSWNLVEMIFGTMPQLENIVYILVGLSGVWLLISHRKECTMCKA